MRLKDAQDIAVAVGYKLMPHCQKLNIAGSIRRRKPDVKDVELVCIANRIEQGQGSMFGTAALPMVVSPEFSKEVAQLGHIVKGRSDGRYMQIMLPEGIALDLFMPEPSDWARQYCIRTGSADFVARFIAGGWKKVGWCGTEDGLRLMKQCLEEKLPSNKSKWHCLDRNPTLPPVWESEEHFFEWLQIRYVEPKDRNV